MVCVLLVTAAVYAHSLLGEQVYEDVRGPESFPTWQGWAELNPSQPFRRLTRWVTIARRSVFGDAPIVAKSTSLALHLVNGALVWRLALLVVPELTAVLAMGLFLLHPLATEAVGYAAMQSELIMALCVLLALWSAAADRTVLAWLLCGLAVTAKEPGIVAFLLVPLWMSGVLRRWTWRAVSGWLVLSLLPAWWAWPILAAHGYGWPLAHTISINLAMLGALLSLTVNWSGLTLAHDWWLLTPSAAFWTCALLAGMAALCWQERWRGLGLLLTWIGLSVAPRLLWPLPDGLHEHHLYLALAGIAVTVSAAIRGPFQRTVTT